MRISEIIKFLQKHDDMEVSIKGFPPDMDAIEILYDITVDVMVIIPARKSVSLRIENT